MKNLLSLALKFYESFPITLQNCDRSLTLRKAWKSGLKKIVFAV